MKKVLQFLNPDVKSLFKWFRVEKEEDFLYLSLYFFTLYIKNTEVHQIGVVEGMRGFYFGKYFVRIV